jgi:hypothetical protein
VRVTRSRTTGFAETVRLPRRFLMPWIAVDVLVTGFFVWLWAVARMTTGQRVGVGVYLIVVLLLLWGGALWFVAALGGMGPDTASSA